MWKQKTDTAESPAPAQPPETSSPVSEPPQPAETPVAASPKPAASAGGATPAVLGHSVVIKGELTSDEDLTIEGRVDGTLESRQHSVVIGEQSTVKAQVFAKHVVVLGKVVGDITASTKVEIRAQGTVEGDLVSPAVAIAEGATFRGSIDMSQQSAESAA